MIDSIRPGDDKSQVVIVVDRTGAITIAGRPTSLAEIQTITSVPGLPEPPAILVEVHRETLHKDVRAIMDVCATAGIWRITFKSMEEESQNQ
jgi:biopolymer transport protein ExbD